MDWIATTVLPGIVIVFTVLANRFSPDEDERIKRALRRARRTSISDARDGEVVTIVGTVRYGQGTLKSGLTGDRCAVSSVVVLEKFGKGMSEVVRENSAVDFYLEDDSGVALIRVGDAPVLTALIRNRELENTLTRPHELIERFMTARGKPIRGKIFFRSLRACEGIVEEGQRVAVCGVARWLADADAAGGSYRESPKRLVLQRAATLGLLHLSNDPILVKI
jgi:hypothetical protein